MTITKYEFAHEDRLRDAAEFAYANARREVMVPSGTPSRSEMTDRQTMLMERLADAERELKAYKAFFNGPATA
jgi:hypothetical protein